MTTTPRKAASQRGACENTPEIPSRSKADQWSRSKVDRFSGHGSIYNSQVGQAPSSASKSTTPSKQVSSLSARYATPAERLAGGTPTKALTSTFASATDRFAGKTPGSVYGASAAAVPEAGQYNPAAAERVKGVIKLQQAARRRQSRGIFSAQEALAREVPSPGKYEPSSLMGAGGGFGFGRGPARFAAQGSIYQQPNEAAPPPAAPRPHKGEDAKDVVAAARPELPPHHMRYSEGGTAVGAYEDFGAHAGYEGLGVVGSVEEEPAVTDEDPADEEAAEDEAVEVKETGRTEVADVAAEAEQEPEPEQEQEFKGDEEAVTSTRDSDVPSIEAAAMEPEDDSEGNRLFSQLMGVATGAAVSRDDYYSADDGWDLSGLRSDLEIFLKSK